MSALEPQYVARVLATADVTHAAVEPDSDGQAFVFDLRLRGDLACASRIWRASARLRPGQLVIFDGPVLPHDLCALPIVSAYDIAHDRGVGRMEGATDLVEAAREIIADLAKTIVLNRHEDLVLLIADLRGLVDPVLTLCPEDSSALVQMGGPLWRANVQVPQDCMRAYRFLDLMLDWQKPVVVACQRSPYLTASAFKVRYPRRQNLSGHDRLAAVERVEAIAEEMRAALGPERREEIDRAVASLLG